METEYEDEFKRQAEAASFFSSVSSTMLDGSSSDEDTKTDHRSQPRGKRREFKHEEALQCILRDYLGNAPLFDGIHFEMMFRISKERYLRLEKEILADPLDSFFPRKFDKGTQKWGASTQAKILLPLKTMAYGVPPHCFTDYFQMSPSMARSCCQHFRKIIKRLYEGEYLRLPDKDDMKAIYDLHLSQHKVPGMFGSLDCMHTWWKNCPMAWQGAYKGKEKKPTIVLEAACDYNLWFWHASYGHAGTNNDISIFNLSPLLENMLNGVFHELESDITPFTINGEIFSRMFLLVDGIYPQYARFVKAIEEPVLADEKKFTKWQESVRKDIERAFGVLQARWQVLARPIHTIVLDDIATTVACCMILHNMCVSDRVMGHVYARYKPSESIKDPSCVMSLNSVYYPSDFSDVHVKDGEDNTVMQANIGGSSNVPAVMCKVLRRRKEWQDLSDETEYSRLQTALKAIVPEKP